MVLAVSALGACAGPTYAMRQYPGRPRDEDQVATLRVSYAEPVRVLEFDGKLVGPPVVAVRGGYDYVRVISSDSRLHFQALPGRHTVLVVKDGDPTGPGMRLSLPMDAGKFYRVTFPPGPSHVAVHGARCYEVDEDSDALGREVACRP